MSDQVLDLSLPANVELAQEIERRRKALYEPRMELKARRTHYPSDMSSCARQMVYNRVAWDKKKPFDLPLVQRFEAGNAVEARIKAELVKMGFELVASGTSMGKASKMERYGISGKLDTVMKWQGKYVLVEIKSMFPQKWMKTNTLEDFEKDPFLRKYIRQMQIYLLGFEIELGLFILDDCMNHWKMVPIYLDYDYAESLLKTVEKANSHIKTWDGGAEGTLPDRVEYGEECKICSFAHECLPGEIREATEIISSVELEDKLSKHDALKSSASAYKSLHEELADVFKYKPRTIIGNFLITSKKSMRTFYEIPLEVKSQYQVEKESFTVSIQNLNEKTTD